jgi:hypothetical protein
MWVSITHFINQQATPIAVPVKERKGKRVWFKSILWFCGRFYNVFSLHNRCLSPHRYTQLAVHFADEFNKTCPMTIDQHTSLKNVLVAYRIKKLFNTNYVLTSISKAEVQLDTKNTCFLVCFKMWKPIQDEICLETIKWL